MKNILAFIGLLVIIGIAGYWYISRPVATPTQNIINDSTLEPTDGTVYTIDQTKSQVSFAINEVLREKPFTAIGTTSNILGDVAFDGKRLTFGTIKVNARTLKTDDTRRDGALARVILKSEQPENEFIVFTPTGMNRVPKTIPQGTPFSFELLGDMTISGTTKPASFLVTLTVNEKTIESTFESQILRDAFGLTIPSLPFIASVDNTITITGTVVANRAE